MSGDVQPRHRHLEKWHEKQRAAALAEIGPALELAARLRAEDGLTWEQAAAVLRERDYVSRSGAPWTTAALVISFNRYMRPK